MRLADEGQQVVFAQRVQLDVLDDHHFIVVGGEQGAVDDFLQAALVTAAQVLHGLGGARWRIPQPLALGVFAEAGEYVAIMTGQIVHGGVPFRKEVSGPVPQSRSKKLYGVHVMYKYMYSFLPAATASSRCFERKTAITRQRYGWRARCVDGRPGEVPVGAVWSANATAGYSLGTRPDASNSSAAQRSSLAPALGLDDGAAHLSAQRCAPSG